jgi:hypothetical protein
VESYKSYLILSEEEFKELVDWLNIYKKEEKCAIFSYSRIICLQECESEPIDAGTLLEEIAHLKLGARPRRH